MDPKIDAESEKVIELALFPSHVDKTGRVHFSTADSLSQSAGKVRPEEARMATKEIRPDLVVYCTGYKVDASWLADEYPRYRDQRIDVREICSSEDISLSVRPSFFLEYYPVLTIRLASSTSDSYDQESERSRRSQNSKRCSGLYSCSRKFPFPPPSLTIDSSLARRLESLMESIIPPTCRLLRKILDLLLVCSSFGRSTEFMFSSVIGQSRLSSPLLTRSLAR